MSDWGAGYTKGELEAAQERYDLIFPPDLFDLLLELQPARGYDWRGENAAIREMLDWPFDTLRYDVEQNGLWWAEWGERPKTADDRALVLKAQLAKAPKLIPLIGHRFIPQEPCLSGNPVLSMYGLDTIYYGANLPQYFDNEFNGRWVVGEVRPVRFWSDLVERGRG